MRNRIVLATSVGAALALAVAAHGQAAGAGGGTGGTGSGMGGTGSGAGMQGSGAGASGGMHQGGQAGAQGTATNLTIGQIASSPSQYYGKSVQVSSSVQGMHGQQLFSLGEKKAAGDAPAEDVLVMTPQAVTELRSDQEVTVKGTLRPLNVAELQRDLTWFDTQRIDPQILSRHAGKPVIIAESIRTSGGQELMRGAAGDAPASGSGLQVPSGRDLPDVGDLPSSRGGTGASDLPGGAGEGVNR